MLLSGVFTRPRSKADIKRAPLALTKFHRDNVCTAIGTSEAKASWRDGGRRYGLWMPYSQSPNPSALCPACGNSMKHVRTIWRWPSADQEIFECRPCGVSIPQAQNQKGDKPTYLGRLSWRPSFEFFA